MYQLTFKQAMIVADACIEDGDEVVYVYLDNEGGWVVDDEVPTEAEGRDPHERVYSVSAELRRMYVTSAIEAAQQRYTDETGRHPGGTPGAAQDLPETLPTDLEEFKGNAFEQFLATLKKILLAQGLVLGGVAVAGMLLYFGYRKWG